MEICEYPLPLLLGYGIPSASWLLSTLLQAISIIKCTYLKCIHYLPTYVLTYTGNLTRLNHLQAMILYFQRRREVLGNTSLMVGLLFL